MNGEAIILLAMNGVVLSAVIVNSFRIGKLSSNGGYLKCPFYRGHIANENKSKKK